MTPDATAQTEAGETDAEMQRLEENVHRRANWKRWGPYLAERQWGTVREDYSAEGDPWNYFPHHDARSRVYRWGEDGLLGITDRQCRLCFALALWNGRDPILKERLFGLTNGQGNHGEDVKELYFYLDATPTNSYLKGLYKYPQAEYPYERLLEENAARGLDDPEYEIEDTGVFDEGRYFDVLAEYAKAGPNDILIRLTVSNRGPDAAELHLLPQLWFRNSWSWGCLHEGCEVKPSLKGAGDDRIDTTHATLEPFSLIIGPGPDGVQPALLFTENETNTRRLYKDKKGAPHARDAFHDRVIQGDRKAPSPQARGTKAAAWYRLALEPGASETVRLRLTLTDEVGDDPLGAGFEETFAARIAEADAFYERCLPQREEAEQRAVSRQAFAGLLWSRQFYHYIVRDWLEGDMNMPTPPPERKHGRNADWGHLYNRDIISMPDKWEYPWYAAWDLAFHMIPLARIDPEAAKRQLILFLREWYMHPNGQIPAYEFNFSDVNPPVHAWACWRIYKMTAKPGQRDIAFLASAFQKLLLNFTWWVNRKDPDGRHLFAGGFLGLDNIGVFDRSRPLPGGGRLAQADGTAWMAFYCTVMLSMALELARHGDGYEDMASKFFEHFVHIADAINSLGGTGLWDEEDGFYYDQLHHGDSIIPLRIRSMVGVTPLFAIEILDRRTLEQMPDFYKRMNWFLTYRSDLTEHIALASEQDHSEAHQLLLAIPHRERLVRVLEKLLDENEFLSPYGVRSLSRHHLEHPFTLELDSEKHEVKYLPGESDSGMFGGNSNWRGPVWFPLNYLLIDALQRYHHFFGDQLTVECPTGSGNHMHLGAVACELSRRLARLFAPDETGHRPCHGDNTRFAEDPHFRDLVLFHEYFHGDTGRGLGASHQTGWTALITGIHENLAGTDHHPAFDHGTWD